MKTFHTILMIALSSICFSCAEYPEDQPEETPVQRAPEVAPGKITSVIQIKDYPPQGITFHPSQTSLLFEAEKSLAIPTQIPNEIELELPDPSIWTKPGATASLTHGNQTKNISIQSEGLDPVRAKVILSGLQYALPDGNGRRAHIEIQSGSSENPTRLKFGLITPPEVVTYEHQLMRPNEMTPIHVPPVTLIPLMSFEMRNTSDLDWMVSTHAKLTGALIQSLYQVTLRHNLPCDFREEQFNHRTQIATSQFLLANSGSTPAELSDLLKLNSDNLQKIAVKSNEELRLILYAVFPENTKGLQLSGRSRDLLTLRFTHRCENLPRPLVFREHEVIYESLLRVKIFESSEVQYDPSSVLNSMKGVELPFSKMRSDY